MAPEARELSARELYSQMSVIDLVVQVDRLADGSRKITSIAEVTRQEEGVHLAEIFRFSRPI